ncbi:hypothetical protein BZA05DRAFT_408416 [Tricharina praecox]|uniref:uncharacterized protein n=1 Tax=Tricharina praecox TaxID=43433 RepID=UPI002221124E|nr:uncharacterized protein BZA05DRAFT_408416 [Tricharina praecox]KAI5845403.1 hypothetical protein BZA05DRAFT_408416 [Tricharina praecox]
MPRSPKLLLLLLPAMTRRTRRRKMTTKLLRPRLLPSRNRFVSSEVNLCRCSGSGSGDMRVCSAIGFCQKAIMYRYSTSILIDVEVDDAIHR